MDSLDDIQRHAVLQLRELVNGADEDVAVSVLSSVEWDVQACLFRKSHLVEFLICPEGGGAHLWNLSFHQYAQTYANA